MIQILNSQAKSIPQIRCDHCGKPITDYGMGMVAFLEPQTEGTYSNVAFLHKGQCDDQAKGGMDRRGGWSELSYFLLDICHNSGLTTDKMPSNVERWNEFRSMGL